jgi:putative membrane protein
MILGVAAAGAATSPAANVAVDPWRFVPHPEVWFTIGVAAAAYWYVLTRIGPRLVGPGQRVASKRQVWCFATGLLTLYVASSWPIHDWAEQYLYSVHMVEHMLISLVAPPLLLLGLPAWLVRWILRPRWASGSVRVLARPLVAGVIFNSVIAIGHAPFYVNYTLYHHFWHFWAHLLLFGVSMLMWFPVVNTLPEYPRMNRPVKMLYLFLQSVIPNVPVAFLAFATGVVYTYYASVPRPFSMGVISDQQFASAIMKVGGTFLLWGIILVVFFRWSAEQERIDAMRRRASRLAAGAAAGLASPERSELELLVPEPPVPESTVPEPSADVLTWAQVEDELARTRPAQPDG